MFSKASVMKYCRSAGVWARRAATNWRGVGGGAPPGGAGVGVRTRQGVVGVGIAILHQEVVQGEVDLVFADVVGERVHDLAPLLIPDIRLILDEDDGALTADFAGASAQVPVELVLEEAVHVVAAVLLLHHHEG